MMDFSGTSPEHLPVADHIKNVKKKIKETSKKFKKLDEQSRRKKRLNSDTAACYGLIFAATYSSRFPRIWVNRQSPNM